MREFVTLDPQNAIVRGPDGKPTIIKVADGEQPPNHPQGWRVVEPLYDIDADVGFGHVFNPAVNVRGEPEIVFEGQHLVRKFPILRKAAR